MTSDVGGATAAIVLAYVRSAAVSPSDLPTLVNRVTRAFSVNGGSS